MLFLLHAIGHEQYKHEFGTHFTDTNISAWTTIMFRSYESNMSIQNLLPSNPDKSTVVWENTQCLGPLT